MPLNGCRFASVCLSVCKSLERKLYLYKTPMYLCILYISVNYVILCCLESICISLSIWVKIFQILTKIHQNQFFIYLYGFKHLVLYNLVVYYSLHPGLVIWYVTLIIFLQIQVYFSKLKKVSFGKSKLGHENWGKQMY